MSRSLYCCLLLLAAHCCFARRIQSKKGEMEVHSGTTGFGMGDAMKIASDCKSQYPESDVEGRILCLCHSVNGNADCETSNTARTGCCMKMTMQAFRVPGVKPWACANLQGKCQPMFPGGGRKIAPRPTPTSAPTSAPTNAPNPGVEERQDDTKDEEEILKDIEFEEEELDLDEEDDIPDDNDDGDKEEKDTADTDDGKIAHCDQIQEPAERALCICGIADSEEKCTGKLAEYVVSKIPPWTCAAHPTSRTCGPIKPVEPDPKPTEAPKPKEEEPQPKDCTGSVESSAWWTAHQQYYSTVFKVGEGSDEYGAEGRVLKCNFVSKNHNCLTGAYTKTTGLQSSVLLEKKKGVRIQCGFDGQWLEPTEMQRQSCAYPLVPKDLKRAGKNGGVIDAGEKVNRVLTVVNGKVETLEWTGGYDLNQLFVVSPDGLIKSLAAMGKCLSGMMEGNWFFTKSGWLEGYLQLHACDESNGRTDPDQTWWLRPDMGDFVRRHEQAGACAMPNSCCSFTYAKTATFATKDSLTFPQVEEAVNDAAKVEYIWRENGKVQEKSEYYVGIYPFRTGPFDSFRDIGLKSAGGGRIDRPSASQVNSRIKENFMVVTENRPKVLNFIKMSMTDTMYTIVDFWKL